MSEKAEEPGIETTGAGGAADAAGPSDAARTANLGGAGADAARPSRARRMRRAAGRWARAFGRWTWRGVCILSLLMWVGLTVLWIRSYWHYDAPIVNHYRAEGTKGTLWTVSLQSCRGGVGVSWSRDASDYRPFTDRWSSEGAWRFRWDHRRRSLLNAIVFYSDQAGLLHELGFGTGSHKRSGSIEGAAYSHRSLNCVAPHWFPFLVLAAVNGWIIVAAARRKRRAGLPLCPQCGYDLRGSLAAGRTACPECGWASAPAAIRGVVQGAGAGTGVIQAVNGGGHSCG